MNDLSLLEQREQMCFSHKKNKKAIRVTAGPYGLSLVYVIAW